MNIDNKKVYRRAIKCFALSLIFLSVGFFLLATPVNQTKRVEIYCRSASNIPPMDLSGKVNSIATSETILISRPGTDDLSVQELPRTLNDELFETQNYKKIQSNPFEVEPINGTDNDTSRGAPRLVVSGSNYKSPVDISVTAKNAFSLSCNYPGDAIYNISSNIGLSFFVSNEGIRVYGTGTPLTQPSIQLPLEATSSNGSSVMDYSDNEKRAYKINLDRLTDTPNYLTGQSLERPNQNSPTTNISLTGVRQYSLIDTKGEKDSRSTTTNLRLALTSWRLISVSSAKLEKENVVHLLIEGNFASIKSGNSEILPTYLQEIFSGNLRFSSPFAASIVGIVLLTLMVIQRCITIVIDTHLPKPVKE